MIVKLRVIIVLKIGQRNTSGGTSNQIARFSQIIRTLIALPSVYTLVELSIHFPVEPGKCCRIRVVDMHPGSLPPCKILPAVYTVTAALYRIIVRAIIVYKTGNPSENLNSLAMKILDHRRWVGVSARIPNIGIELGLPRTIDNNRSDRDISRHIICNVSLDGSAGIGVIFPNSML